METTDITDDHFFQGASSAELAQVEADPEMDGRDGLINKTQHILPPRLVDVQ